MNLLFAMPLSAYANFTGNPHLNVLASASGIIIGFIVCISAIIIRKNNDF